MTVNKDDKVLITKTGWAGSVAKVIEVLSSGNIRVIREDDPLAIVGIVVEGEWETYEEPYVEPVTHAFKVGDTLMATKWGGGPYKVTKVLPTSHYYNLFFGGHDDGYPYEALPENYVLVTDESDALDALRAIRARLADNALMLGFREDILSIIANVKGV